MGFVKGQSALGVATRATARRLRGQSALDFLMTHGWALALLVIVFALLFSLGIFDVGGFVGSKSSGFSGVGVTGWKLTPAGNFSMRVANQVSAPINISSINVAIRQVPRTLAPNVSVLALGQVSQNASAGGFGSSAIGTTYIAKVRILYKNMINNFTYTTEGTLTGRVSS
jgi:hypothetical protein